jgi:hypothetical protein
VLSLPLAEVVEVRAACLLVLVALGLLAAAVLVMDRAAVEHLLKAWQVAQEETVGRVAAAAV